VSRPAIYSELASWYPLLTTPQDYDEEAAFILQLLQGHEGTLLELGAGAGHLASHLKSSFQPVLTDLSPEMLALSEQLNPDCEHHVGDMRTLRLDRTFDAVLVHDAITYMTTEQDLRAALQTAFVHLRPGGLALFFPDQVQETFQPSTDSGGYDGPDRALRYLEWSADPDPTDTTCVVDYVWMLRQADGSVQIFQDRLVEGLFSKQTWLELLQATGFQARALDDPWGRVPFLGLRP
jgi:SAM-dependent methyltransferase